MFISYVDQLSPSWERQGQLQQQYYFRCTCPRCHDTDLDHLMTSGAEDSQLQEAGSAAETVEALSESCQAVVNKVDSLKTSGAAEDVEKILPLCKECLARVEGRLSAFNVHRVRLLDRAYDAAIGSGEWEEALGYIVQTLQPYRRLYSTYSPNLALQLMRAGKLQLFLGHTQEADKNLVQAESILKVTHGQDSDLYQRLGDLLHQCVTELGTSQRTSSPALH